MKFSLVELTVLVHALRYVDFQYVNILPNFDKLDILYYGLYEGFNKDENIFNYPIVKQTFVKLRQVINHYDNLIPKPVILGYADFARTNNQLMYFQNYIIRKALIEMFERNPEEYDSFIKTWRIEPHGNDKNPEAVMGVVGILR
uniref:Uncharacterized protein n=1 Tax=Meloidogyne hapla TaxID=6305 RepID=A0A1I8BN15_MELHA